MGRKLEGRQYVKEIGKNGECKESGRGKNGGEERL